MLTTLLISSWLLGPPIQRPSQVAPVEWQAPDECPEVADVVARIDALAPGVLAGVNAGRPRVAATISAIESGYQVEVVLTDGDGEFRRVLVGVGCEEVTDAVALLVAVLLDPVRAAGEVRALRAATPAQTPARESSDPPSLPLLPPLPPGPPPARADVEAEDPREDVLVVEPTRVTRSPIRLGLKITGGGGYGPTSAGFADLGGTMAVFAGRWRLELGGAWTPARELRGTGEVFGGRFTAWRLAVRGCFVPQVGARERLEFPLCPGFEFGQVRGRGLGELPVVLEATFPWIALALGQGLWFAPIERLAIGVDLQLAVPLRGGRFLIEATEIQRIAPVTVRGLLGIELRLP